MTSCHIRFVYWKLIEINLYRFFFLCWLLVMGQKEIRFCHQMFLVSSWLINWNKWISQTFPLSSQIYFLCSSIQINICLLFNYLVSKIRFTYLILISDPWNNAYHFCIRVILFLKPKNIKSYLLIYKFTIRIGYTIIL